MHSHNDPTNHMVPNDQGNSAHPDPVDDGYLSAHSQKQEETKVYNKNAKIPQLPALASPHSLGQFFDICEQLIMEADLDPEQLRIKMAIVHGTKDFDQVYQMGLSLLSLNWPSLKAKLLHSFANPGTIRLEFNRKLEDYKFVRDTAASDMRGLYEWHSRAGGSVSNHEFFSRIVAKIPIRILEKVMERCRLFHPQWHWRDVPMESFLDTVEEVCLLLTELEGAIATSTTSTSKTTPVRRVAQAPTGKSSTWLEEWVKPFGQCYYLRSTDQALITRLTEAATEFKKMRSKSSYDFYILGLADTSVPAAVKGLPEQVCRPFVLRRSPASKN